MFKISTHICDELSGSDVMFTKLNESESEKIFHLVSEKYINPNLKGEWLWERFSKYAYINDNMAWSYIKNFIQTDKCIMFFNQQEEKSMFSLQSGMDLNYILAETYGYEFYVTNSDCSYLICFNHHNTLYGCGDAEKWINDINNR